MRDTASLIIQISKGLIRNQRMRRSIMFYGLLGALVMLFLGSAFFHQMREHPFFFLIYWGACAWITLLAMLLAVFDLLLVRAAGRRARKKLESEYLRETANKTNHGSDASGT